MPTRPFDLSKQWQGMEALARARREVTKIMAKRKLSTARRMNVPQAAENGIRPVIDVPFCNRRPVNRWAGPYKVFTVDGKQVWLHSDENVITASLDRMESYVSPSTNDEES